MIAATSSEILGRVRVMDIYSALGGEVPRRGNRTRCILHRGDNQTFSINEQKGVWHCFACNEGGGKIALVRKARNCEPKAALEWIANLAGISLAPCSREEQHARTMALSHAEQEGRALIDWKAKLIASLREERDCVQTVYWLGIRVGLSQADEEWLWGRIAEFDQKINWHEDQPWEVMVSIYRDSLTISWGVYRRAV